MHSALLPVIAFAMAFAAVSARAAPLDFDAYPITCTDPVGPPGGAVGVPPGGCDARPRPDGYAIVGYSFSIILPPQPPAPPPPQPPVVGQHDSERPFDNPIMQDLLAHIWGDTEVEVQGAPMLFFVTGTLDGNPVVNFSQVVGPGSTDISWDVWARVDDVAAGGHTADMHFGVMQIGDQGSQVNVSSLYQISMNPASVPEPASHALGLVGLALGGLAARSTRRAR